MARILTDGAEMGDLTVFNGGFTASVTNISTNPSSGSRCYRFTGPSGIISVPANSEYFVRTRIRPDSVSGATNLQVLVWRNGTTTLGSTIINTVNNLVATVTGSSGSSAVANIPALQYSMFETHIKIANTGGVIECAIDGVPIFGFTGDTQPASLTTIDNFLWGAAGTTSFNMDDIAINDTSGLNDNTWCGDGRVLAMIPNADGDVIQLSRGGTDTGANWSQVDEIPPNSDTDYVYSTGSGLYDLYNLTSGSAIVPTDGTIARVWVESRSREVAADGDSIQLGIKSSGSENWSTDIPVTTSYLRYTGSEMLVNPITSAGWTISDLDNLQAGVKVVA